jgi:hypothetical protein
MMMTIYVTAQTQRNATQRNPTLRHATLNKTERYGVTRICFEMTRQATMPSLRLQMNNTYVYVFTLIIWCSPTTLHFKAPCHVFEQIVNWLDEEGISSLSLTSYRVNIRISNAMSQ